MAFFILLLISAFPLNAQPNEKEFEKKYLEFHEKWDSGYDASLEEVEEIFKDCPDLQDYPHYFIYKGDLFRNSGYFDLALKYYLIAERLIKDGKESKKIYDHTPIMYFKLGYTYYELDIPEKFNENILKGKEYVTRIYSPINDFLFTELEAIYKFHYTDERKEAIDLLEEVYTRIKKNPESHVYPIINRARLRAIDMALEISEYETAERILNLVNQDPWINTINGDYLRMYYSSNRDYLYQKKEFNKALIYNDSIYFTPPLELEDKESQFENYIKIYAALDNMSASERFKDSLNSVFREQRKKRIGSSVQLAQENHNYEQLVASISTKNKRQKYFWFLSVAALLIIILAVIIWYRKRKYRLEKQLLRETQKVELLNDNYHQLLKNYQFTSKQLEKIKQTLAVEMQKHKSPEIISFHKSISNTLPSNLNDKLLSINKMRDQFMLNLKERFPELSNYEALICFYSKMGLSAKEISQIANLTVRSVQSHQYRIGQKTKKKLNVKLKDLLEEVPLSVG